MSSIGNPESSPEEGLQVVPQPEPVPARPRFKAFWIGLAVVALGAVAAYGLRRNSDPARPQPDQAAVATVKVGTGTLDRVIRVSGQTAARTYANVIAPILRGPEQRGQLVILKLASAGTLVKKGDVVMEIDPGTAQDHIDDLKATVEQADMDSKKREAEHLVDMENLKQTLRVAKADLDKAKWDASAAEVRSEVERMLLQLAHEESQARSKQLEGDVAFKQVSQKADLAILGFTAERHKRHLNRHLSDITRYAVRAPMDGLVVLNTIYRGGGEGQQIQQGDQVFPGQLVMKIVDPKSMQVEATLNQAESSDFRIGQQAKIGLDAFPGLQFQGRIDSMGALATGGFRPQYYLRTVPIKLTILGSHAKLIPDLSASADVLIERVENAALIPVSAISTENGRRYVWVKSGETFQKREVKLGLKNDTQATVTEGLKAGEEIRAS